MARVVLMVGFVLGLAASGPAAAAPVARQATDEPWKICAAQSARQEAALGLPRHLLSAIGKAESGRFDEINRANVAWPWTVTAEGEGRFFASAAEALTEVRRLKARKVTNIDVGCMQVNLGYHGHRFASLEEAMDPVANTAYAARFLKSLRETSADWMEAAGRYHSSQPERNVPYRAKVARLWDDILREDAKRAGESPRALNDAPLSGRAADLPAPTGAGFAKTGFAALSNAMNSPGKISERSSGRTPSAPLRPSLVAIDHGRTALLNANFRAARSDSAPMAGLAATIAEAPNSARERQLAYLREGEHPEVLIAADAAGRRALAEAERRRAQEARRIQPGTPAAVDRFAAKRASDLSRWRATRPGGAGRPDEKPDADVTPLGVPSHDAAGSLTFGAVMPLGMRSHDAPGGES